MASDGSVTHWITQLKAGEQAAAQPLWEQYFRRLVALARKKLQDLPRRAMDEEDVALSAFASLCHGAATGRFPQLTDRNDLWHLLVAITANKAHNVLRDQRRQKRGGGAVRGESALLGPPAFPEVEAGLDQVVGPEPTPEFAAQVAEQYQHLLDQLGDAELRAIALGKLDGDTIEEIADKLGRSPRTIERKLLLIRNRWKKELEP